MSTLVDRPVEATHENGEIRIKMQSGDVLSFPVAGNPRLEGQSHEVLSDIEVSPFGLHWPQVDEDLSMRGIIGGNYGQP